MEMKMKMNVMFSSDKRKKLSINDVSYLVVKTKEVKIVKEVIACQVTQCSLFINVLSYP